MLRTGDVGDYHEPTSKPKGRPEKADMDRINAEMKIVIAKVRNGASVTECAHELGINHKTLAARLRNRGLTVRKIRNQTKLQIT